MYIQRNLVGPPEENGEIEFHLQSRNFIQFITVSARVLYVTKCELVTGQDSRYSAQVSTRTRGARRDACRSMVGRWACAALALGWLVALAGCAEQPAKGLPESEAALQQPPANDALNGSSLLAAAEAPPPGAQRLPSGCIRLR